MNEPLVKYFQCIECKKVKDWSEMHNKTLCKICWGKTDDKYYADRAFKALVTKRTLAKVKRVLNL